MTKSTMGAMAMAAAVTSVLGLSAAAATEAGCTSVFLGTSSCAGGRAITTGLIIGGNKALRTHLRAGRLAEAWGRLPNGQLIPTCYVADTTPGSGADPIDRSGCNSAVTKRVHVVF